MATQKEITTYKNRFMKAVKEKDWDKAGDAIGWLTQLDETERDSTFRELLDFLNKEIKSKDDEAFLFLYRGAAKYAFNDYVGTIADYDEAIRLNPENPVAFHNRAIAVAKEESDRRADEIEANLLQSFEGLTKPEKIINKYEEYLKNANDRLDVLREREIHILGILTWLTPLFWFVLLIGLIALSVLTETETAFWEFILSTFSISLATGFLISPTYLALRQNRINQRTERLAMEDYKRNLTLLLLRMVDGDEAARRDRTSKAFDHFADNSTVEVLERNYRPKYFARKNTHHKNTHQKNTQQATEPDDGFVERLAQKLAQKLSLARRKQSDKSPPADHR